jgi:hypothetical protein
MVVALLLAARTESAREGQPFLDAVTVDGGPLHIGGVSTADERLLELGHEMQSSSGVIVSTGLGSTAWIRSSATGAARIAENLGAAAAGSHYRKQPWDASFLQFAVREPFPSVATQATLVYGRTDRRRRWSSAR